MFATTRATVEVVSVGSPHSCDICASPEYQKAREILVRSGLQPDKWGFLLHDIARELIAAGVSQRRDA